MFYVFAHAIVNNVTVPPAACQQRDSTQKTQMDSVRKFDEHFAFVDLHDGLGRIICLRPTTTRAAMLK
jgi:hypothetical protein